MFKLNKHKTGALTPKFRKPTEPPAPKFEDLDPDKKWKHCIRNLCGKISNQADDVVKTINESGFEKPVLVMKLFSDHTCVVYVNEWKEEENYD